MKGRQRLAPETRRGRILEAALKLAEKRGYGAITREEVAEAAGVSVGLVTWYFQGMAGLRKAIISRAVELENAAVVAQGLAARDPLALAADDSLKNAALKTLI